MGVERFSVRGIVQQAIHPRCGPLCKAFDPQRKAGQPLPQEQQCHLDATCACNEKRSDVAFGSVEKCAFPVPSLVLAFVVWRLVRDRSSEEAVRCGSAI
eukprot:6240613-Amphidinium_carterae.1